MSGLRINAQFYLSLALLSGLAFFLQSHIYLHRDVGYLTHEAGLLLQGQIYAKDVFEPNPPLILFLSMPSVWLTKVTGIDVLSTIRLYVILLAAFSCSLSYFLIKKLFTEKLLIWMVTFTTVFTLLFLPAHQFGQREHLLMILIYPYLFATGLRLDNKTIPLFLAVLIGLMAGIGFAIKPHFLLTLILIETYFIFSRKKLFERVRVETICILLFLLGYICVIGLFFKSYLTIIYPLWWPFYKSISLPWHYVLSDTVFLFSLGPLFFYFFLKKFNRYSHLSNVLLLALIGLIIAFLQPKVVWYYHILPALSLACVLYAIIFSELLLQNKTSVITKADWIFNTGLALLFFAFPIYLTSGYFVSSLQDFRRLNTFEILISFLQKEGPNNSYDYFANTHNLSILEYYSKANYVGRFPSLWWFYDLSLQQFNHNTKAKLHQEKYFSFLNDLVADDLTVKKPKFVILDTQSAEENVGLNLNYINELSSSRKFRIAWKKYHYYKTLERYRIYAREE